MTLNRQRWMSLGLLALLFFALGIFMVPAHFGSLWGDRDFTDWSVPIANRLHGPARLYQEGLHSPMPPLPFILPRVLFPHGAIWLDGSVLNYTFQSGMILLLFWFFSGEFGVDVALVAALAAIPVYLSMPKTMLYDSMAQFFVAVTGIAATGFVRARNRELLKPPSQTQNGMATRLRLAGVGAWLALLLLTKQNTGAGASAGVCAALLLLPRLENFKKRCANILFILGATAIVFCAVALAFSRFLSFSGLIHDVFLTGSEPKGGPVRMVESLVIFCLQMAVIAGGLYLLICIFDACVGTGRPSWAKLVSGGRWIIPEETHIESQMEDDGIHKPDAQSSLAGYTTPLVGGRIERNVLCAALVGSALGLGLSIIYARTGISLKGTMMDAAWGTLVLNYGLCLVLGVIALLVIHVVATRDRDRDDHPIAPYAVVFLLGALFHNLSVKRLRWTVDNNPLVYLALVLVVVAFLAHPGEKGAKTPSRNGRRMESILTAFLIFIMWPLAHFLTLNIVTSTKSWPEIKHLAGARLRPESEGMRKLVLTVRSFADPARKDAVLLLPNDPNVEAWFERDQPRFSSAIIFTDQYWDRYVDRDFASLQAHPPKVIIIGPRNYWRFFCRGWNVNRGAERFIDLVLTQLIPKDYELKSEQEIAYQGGTDFMDVYVRRGAQ